MKTGETLSVGWNGAKLLGSEFLAHETVRVEAIGVDWVVVRDRDGQAFSAVWVLGPSLVMMVRDLEA